MADKSKKPCPTCGGSGLVNGSTGLQKCPMCEGTGEKFQPGLFFEYEMGPIALGANGQVSNFSVQILDRSFKWMMLTGVFTGAFTILIKDSRNKRPFSNQQIHCNNMIGTATNPFPLLTPFVFERRGSILADLTDLSGNANTIRLGFIGVELDDDQ
jgi:hypothetical protein